MNQRLDLRQLRAFQSLCAFGCNRSTAFSDIDTLGLLLNRKVHITESRRSCNQST